MVNSWQLGNVRIDRVVEFEMPMIPPAVIFPASTPEAIARHKDWLEPKLLDPASGLLVISMHSFLIRSRHHTILVDSCSGNDRQRPGKPRYHMKNWPFLENLAKTGVKPAGVDFVLCTHLHVDHVGWNTQLVDGRWVPAFPNAKYLFARAEWEYWREHYKTEAFRDDPYYTDSILPVIESGQMELVDSNYVFDEEVWLDPTPGHTPGHVCVHISSGGQECVMSGDLMHHALQCAEPDWSSCFCVDPAHAARTRRAFLARYEGTPVRIMPAHFPAPTAGTIERAGEAWRFRFEGGSASG